MKNKKVIYGLYAVVLVLIVAVVSITLTKFQNSSVESKIQGTWQDSESELNWISFNVPDQVQTDSQFNYFFMDGDRPLEGVQPDIYEEGLAHFGNEKDEIIFDTGTLAGETLKLNTDEELTRSNGQVFTKIDDIYTRVLKPNSDINQ